MKFTIFSKIIYSTIFSKNQRLPFPTGLISQSTAVILKISFLGWIKKKIFIEPNL